MNSHSRIRYLDLLRITACFLVVMIHVTARLFETVLSDRIVSFYNCVGFTGVALFVMMSGALSLREGREADIRSILLHKTLRFFVLYYIWKAFYQAVAMLEIGEPFNLINIKNEIILASLTKRGAAYHLWFLPMIAMLYMFVPLIRKGVEDRKVCVYFLSVFFSVHILWETLQNYDFRFRYVFEGFFENNTFELFGGYLGYFILGHYLHTWGDSMRKEHRTALYILGGVSLAVSFFQGSVLNTPFAATAFFMAGALFLLGRRSGGQPEDGDSPAPRLLSGGAKCTLGIYLIHPLILSRFPAQAVSAGLRCPGVFVPAVTVCVFLLSGAVSAVLLKIPVLKKLVQ